MAYCKPSYMAIPILLPSPYYHCLERLIIALYDMCSIYGITYISYQYPPINNVNNFYIKTFGNVNVICIFTYSIARGLVVY